MQQKFLSEKGALAGLYEKVRSGQFFHAVILEGAHAFDAALEYSCACVCTGQNAPCGICPDCLKAKKQIHPDIFLAQGSGISRSISVDTIRFIREDAFKKTNEAPRKVYLIEDAENMTDSAQNALLKILEEPPVNVVFVLICSNAMELLSTVLSRCQLYSLENEQNDPEAFSLAEKFALKLIEPDEMDYLSLSEPLIRDKDLFSRFSSQLLELLRNALVYRTCGKTVSLGAEKLGDMLTEDRLFRLYSLADNTAQKTENKQLGLNQALLVSSFFAQARGIRYGTFMIDQ